MLCVPTPLSATASAAVATPRPYPHASPPADTATWHSHSYHSGRYQPPGAVAAALLITPYPSLALLQPTHCAHHTPKASPQHQPSALPHSRSSDPRPLTQLGKRSCAPQPRQTPVCPHHGRSRVDGAAACSWQRPRHPHHSQLPRLTQRVWSPHRQSCSRSHRRYCPHAHALGCWMRRQWQPCAAHRSRMPQALQPRIVVQHLWLWLWLWLCLVCDWR